MTNLSILPQVSVIAVWADNYLLRTVFVDMPLEKPFLKFGPTVVRTQHVHKLTVVSVFLKKGRHEDLFILFKVVSSNACGISQDKNARRTVKICLCFLDNVYRSFIWTVKNASMHCICIFVIQNFIIKEHYFHLIDPALG